MIKPKDKIQQIYKFINADNMPEELKPKEKMNDKQIYNSGGGIFVGYSNNKFKIENITRIEYDKAGEYFISAYFFKNSSFASNVLTEDLNHIEKFEHEENWFLNYFYFDNLKELTWNLIQEKINSEKNLYSFLQEGETRSMNADRSFTFNYKYIKVDDIILMFFGKSKNEQLGCIEYMFKEKHPTTAST